jgi:hypothetical protein
LRLLEGPCAERASRRQSVTHCRCLSCSQRAQDRHGQVRVFNDGRGESRFRLKASNGETVASGREL